MCEHLLVPNHGLQRVIATLDQHIRPQHTDQFQRGVLVEQHHRVHRRERCHHPRPLTFAYDRPRGALQPANRSIRIQAQHQLRPKSAAIL